jgi:hypothetical protein
MLLRILSCIAAGAAVTALSAPLSPAEAGGYSRNGAGARPGVYRYVVLWHGGGQGWRGGGGPWHPRMGPDRHWRGHGGWQGQWSGGSWHDRGPHRGWRDRWAWDHRRWRDDRWPDRPGGPGNGPGPRPPGGPGHGPGTGGKPPGSMGVGYAWGGASGRPTWSMGPTRSSTAPSGGGTRKPAPLGVCGVGGSCAGWR